MPFLAKPTGNVGDLRQFNPGKPDKFHIRAFSFVDGHFYYCLNFCIYGGKKHHKYDPDKCMLLDLIVNKLAATLPDFIGMLAYRVSSYLSYFFAGKHRILFGDNFYSTYYLVLALAHLGVRYVGTHKVRLSALDKKPKSSAQKNPLPAPALAPLSQPPPTAQPLTPAGGPLARTGTLTPGATLATASAIQTPGDTGETQSAAGTLGATGGPSLTLGATGGPASTALTLGATQEPASAALNLHLPPAARAAPAMLPAAPAKQPPTTPHDKLHTRFHQAIWITCSLAGTSNARQKSPSLCTFRTGFVASDPLTAWVLFCTMTTNLLP